MSYSVSRTHCSPKDAIAELDYYRAHSAAPVPDNVYENAVAVFNSYESKGVTLLDFTLHGHDGTLEEPHIGGQYSVGFVVAILEVSK